MSDAPTISLIITAHDYRHFLPACLDSLFAQSVAADEIILVDDGSRDGTAEMLTRYGDRLTVICQENRGQAAAFNAGFAAATGAVVLFVDADDKLEPLAVEAIKRHWREGIAALTFGLATIDAQGRTTSLYGPSVHPDVGDNRPRVLRTGTFCFPPTTGNAFCAQALRRVLPMKEDGWRTSADCVVIRGAALVGPFAAIPDILGQYRLHGTNHYAHGAPGASDAARRRSDENDAARALRDLAERADTLADTAEERAPLSAMLRARAAALEAGSLPPPRALGGRRRTAGRPPTEVAPLCRPRTPTELPLGEWITPGVRFDVRVPRAFPDPLGRDRGADQLVFALPPSEAALNLSLAIAAEGDCDILVDGVLSHRGPVDGEWPVVIELAMDPLAAGRTVEVVAVPTHGETDVEIDALRIDKVTADASFAYLPSGRSVPAAALAAAAQGGGWRAKDGRLTLAGPTGNLRIATHPAASDLIIELGDPVPAGFLTIRDGCGGTLAIATGPGKTLVMRLGEERAGPRTLHVAFERHGSDGAALSIEALAVAHHLLTHHERPVRTLNVGERLSFAPTEGASDLLREGWQPPSPDDEADGFTNAAAEAAISFRVSPSARDVAVNLSLAAALPPSDGARHIVAVSQKGSFLAAGPIVDSATITAPLADTAGEIEIVLHSVFAGEADDAPDAPRTAPVELQSLWLTGHDTGLTLPPAAEQTRSAFEALLSGADGADAEEIAALLRQGSTKALAIIATSEGGLPALERMRRPPSPRADGPHARLRTLLSAIGAQPAWTVEEAAHIDRLPGPLLVAPANALSWLTAEPMLETAADHVRYRAFLVRLYQSVERILAREATHTARFAFARQLLERLRTTRTIFGTGSVREFAVLRARAIERLLLRQGHPLAAAFPRSAPREPLRLGVLVRDVHENPEGFALSAMYRGLDRARFAPVLLRMDANGAEAPAGVFCEEHDLSGMDVAPAVAHIRSLALDLFITGAYAADYERTTALLAHRLAPVQIWAGAVCPTTSGLRSFDVALTCRATEPADPERHYAEPLAFIDGAHQAAYAFPAPRAVAAREDVRADLDVSDDAVLLVSGAMAHKVDDALLAAFSRILAGAPRAVLVLYPYASNWSMAFAAERFAERLNRALHAEGVDRARARILKTQPPERVREIARAADLYLDSFPYTGATTVCEALSVGTPVVTLEGDGLRERTGASWVRAYGLDECVCRSAQEVVATAVRLANDRDALAGLRAAVARQAGQAAPPHCATEAFGRDFGAALWQIAERTGAFDLSKLAARGPRPFALPSAIAPPPAAPPFATQRARKMVRAAILTNPRSGSTVLCNLLNGTQGSLCHYELFHADMIQYADREETGPDTLAARDADPVAFLEAVFRDADAAGYSLCAFKHFDHLSADITDALMADRSVRLIHLVRDNILAQFSSEEIAADGNRWFAGGDDLSPPEPIVFDRARFERFESVKRDILARRTAAFAKNGRAPLVIDYASLFAPEIGAHLSNFLGVEIMPRRAFDFARQNSADILSRFSNPEEVAAYLAERGLERWSRDLSQ